jgi:uncharacterized protein YfiM (DUF2279 family)
MHPVVEKNNRNSFSPLPGKLMLWRLQLLLILLFLQVQVLAQDSTSITDQLELDSGWKANPGVSGVRFNHFSSEKWEPLLSPEQKRRRTWLIGGANVAGYGGTMIALYHSWYKNYPQSKFHTFNDWREWKQVDKVGHMYSAYIESYGSMKMWQWAGMDRKKRIWIGGMSGAMYQTVIEVLDGFSTGWGWSWGDFSANMLGSGALVAQELAWDEQRIKLKFSFHKKNYTDPELNQRSDKLFGHSLAERMLKDYNGQTYWASANLKSFFKQSRLPDWLSVSVGYGAEGLFGGTENIGKDDDGNIIFNRPDIKRYRQWFLAPDIDLTKIKTNKKGLKFLFTVLSAFKFPTPSLEYGNGRFRLHALHF